ncbi:ferrous iron transport protein B [Archaeoglobales archaeon]|nr:MAG: ferrous iron transport protein B [Archaeoglobales archaeon]
MVGNPNVGKTALLNALTGGDFVVGNFPGTTVEKKIGKGKINGKTIEFVDLPGIYSLQATSLDEKIARDYIVNENPDLILNVIDASNLERNLYLTLQLLDFQKPMILVLNLIDEAKSKGVIVNSKKLEEILGIPVVETIAVENVGIEELKRKILEGGKVGAVFEVNADIEKRIKLSEEIAKKVVEKKKVAKNVGDMLDEVFTDKYVGALIFFSFMWMVFRFTYDVASPFVNLIDVGISRIVDVISGESLVSSLIADGIITGVGSVLIFVPNIAFLFIALSVLELSGYMARAVFVMDKTMERFGLNGRAVVPLIMGFGCNVPAIMATRAIEDRKIRLVTILVDPFISCSARLPIYVLFAGAFFAGMESIVIMFMYLLGVLLALFSALALRKFVFKGEAEFIMEFPSYRIPKLKDVWMLTWNRTKHFLQKAGTVIFVMSIVIWYLTRFPVSEIQYSYAGTLGKLIQPIFIPMGWGWELSVALIMGFVAKEVVVETLGIVLGNPMNIANLISPAQALGFMVFTLLYMPCLATLAAIRAETESWKWTVFAVVYGLIIAYVMALIVTVVGGLIL